MPQYQSPGVYIQEVPAASVPFGRVSTSTAGFIGYIPAKSVLGANQSLQDVQGRLYGRTGNTETSTTPFPLPVNNENVVQVPIKRTLTGYETNVVVLPPADEPQSFTSFSAFALRYGDLIGDTGNHDLACVYEVPKSNWNDCTATLNGWRKLVHAVYGFFLNGGTRCWVAHVTADSTAGLEKVNQVLTKFEARDEIAIVALPGIDDINTKNAAAAYCQRMNDRFAILDSAPLDLGSNQRLASDAATIPAPNKFAAFYYPQIKVSDPSTKVLQPEGDGTFLLGPSGHVAGVYARVDAERGSYKAPANETLRGVVGLEVSVTRNEQDGLNPKGINVIRNINGGITIWGARTLGGDDNGVFRYISTRRYFSYLCKTIERNTLFVVFEPNTPALWQQVKRSVEDFLMGEWRDGGLFGETAKDAFFVKCDAETNPPDSREQGQLIVQVGVAIVKPAEFVIFKVQQTTGG